MILAFIEKYGSASRKEINELLLNKLSDVLNEDQKKSKVGNLLTVLRKQGKINNSGNFKKPLWVLKE